jgi:hypothetical protein
MALHATRWATIRKGVVLGLFTGWLYFINYAMYAFGFIIGSFFIMWSLTLCRLFSSLRMRFLLLGK